MLEKYWESRDSLFNYKANLTPGNVISEEEDEDLSTVADD